MTVVASQDGFYPAGKRALLSHSLLGLLQQISRAFDSVRFNTFLVFVLNSVACITFLVLVCFLIVSSLFAQAYKALMKAFLEHNKVGVLTFIDLLFHVIDA